MQGIKISRLYRSPLEEHEAKEFKYTDPLRAYLPLGGVVTEALTQANTEVKAQAEALQARNHHISTTLPFHS